MIGVERLIYSRDRSYGNRIPPITVIFFLSIFLFECFFFSNSRYVLPISEFYRPGEERVLKSREIVVFLSAGARLATIRSRATELCRDPRRRARLDKATARQSVATLEPPLTLRREPIYISCHTTIRRQDWRVPLVFSTMLARHLLFLATRRPRKFEFPLCKSRVEKKPVHG